MPRSNDHEARADSTAATATQFRVLEISDGIAGAYAGWLLQQLGADVARVDKEKVTCSADPLTLACSYFNVGKRASSESTSPVWSNFEIVITDDVRQLEAVAGCSLAELSADSPTTIFAAATVFGLTGPLASAPAVPLDAQAVSGAAWALGEAGREPLSIPPGILECQAGAHLAAASLMAHYAGAGPRVVDIALADVLSNYVAANCRFYIHHGMEWRRAGRRASNSGGAYPFVILPCKDGDVCLSGRTLKEWQRFVEAMGSPDWTRQPRYQKLRAMGQQYPEEVDALIQPWLRLHTKAEIAEIAHSHHLTIAPLRSFAEVLATSQLHDRGFLKTSVVADKTVLGPTLPFKFSERRSPTSGAIAAPAMLALRPSREARREAKALSGLRVVDFGWVWSAPQVGSILAQFGAEVIKVEHGRRLDNARMSGSVIRNGRKVEGQTTNMSPMFHQINQGKLGITLNMKVPAAVDIARRLVASSDIVLENMSAGSMERSGLGYEALREINPRLIMLAMSGAGQFGPLADMRTYAPVMSSFVGLESLVGYIEEAPVGALNFALGDPNAAAHALVAIFAALVRRKATGRGCYVDLSQTEALLTTLTPYLLEAQATGQQPVPQGNSHPLMAPHGIYPASGSDRWLTIAVADDRQWQSLVFLAAGNDWMKEQRLETMAGRRAARRELDDNLARWTSTQDRDGLVGRLRSVGIASSSVLDIVESWAAPQMQARALIYETELPTLGPERLFRAPWTFSDAMPDKGGRGPLLGEHNEMVLKDMLGISALEYARLQSEGAIE